MSDSFVLSDVSMEIHHGKFTLGISWHNQSRTWIVLIPDAVKISQSFTRLSFPPVASMKCGALPLVS